MRDLLLVGAGGFVGAILRYVIGLAVLSRTTTPFPVHTFLINVTGCLALGVIMGAAETRAIAAWIRPALAVGVLGAYTTFSTFGWETVALATRGETAVASLYVLASTTLGLAAAAGGAALGRAL
jgi:CrcB protein